MSLRKGFLLIGVGSLALLTSVGVADETAPATVANNENVAAAEQGAKPAAAEQGAKPAPSDSPAAAREAMEQLIEQLDAPDFDTRERACGKLAAMGKTAVAVLEKAAAKGNLEVSSRATTVLGKLLKSSDEATENAASEALQHLADGDSASAARKAKSILDRRNGLKNNGPGFVVPGNGFGGQIIINGGQLNINGGAMRTLSVKNANGVKEINAVEDGKTVKVLEDPAKGIKVEVSEKQNGKEVTKKYDAKNVEDLKKLPAGYEIYKKYVGDQPANGIMQFRIQAGGGNLQIPGNAIPAIPLQPALPLQPRQPLLPAPAMPRAAAPQANNPQQIEVATRLLKTLSSRLERLPKEHAYKNASPESKAELRKQIDGLSKQLESLREQLGDKQ
ncbi:MAG: HEAT repeat domain-containing protein [Thermoguttaceae bacterium]